MATPLEAFSTLPNVATVRVDDVDAFVAAAPGHAVLLFSGETKRRPEAQDVAVVLREMAKTYAGAVRFGVVDGAHEDRLKTRFGVVVLPTVVFLDGAETLATMPRIQDWPAYAAKFREFFGAPPARAA